MRITTVLVSDRTELYEEMYPLLLEKGVDLLLVHSEDNLLVQLTTSDPDIVILDCCSKELQWLTYCQAIRKRYGGPLLLLSYPEHEQFIILALQLGADFSLSAQSSTRFIVENLHALMRRFISAELLEFESGELKIDAGKRDAFISGRSVNLSTIEFQVLWLLCRKAGQVVPRGEIHRKLYNTQHNGYDRSVDLYVSRIRRKIGDSHAMPRYLKTVHGVGYQFVGQEASQKLTTSCDMQDTVGLLKIGE